MWIYIKCQQLSILFKSMVQTQAASKTYLLSPLENESL